MKTIFKTFILLCAMSIYTSQVYAQQTISSIWGRLYGGSGLEHANKVIQTSNNGFIAVGYTTSSANGHVSNINNGGKDLWVVKTLSNGSLEWQVNLGGLQDEEAIDVKQLADNSYIIVGYTNSNNTGNVGVSNGGKDMWIVKLTSTGSLSWQKMVGSAYNDQATNVALVAGGDYIISGINNDTWGSPYGHVFRLSNNGNTIVWSRGGTFINDMKQTNTNTYVLVGYVENGYQSSYWDYSDPMNPMLQTFNTKDGYIEEIDADGYLIWSNIYGEEADDEFTHIDYQGSGNNLVVAGIKRENYFASSGTQEQAFLIKADTSSGAALSGSYLMISNFVTTIHDMVVFSNGNVALTANNAHNGLLYRINNTYTQQTPSTFGGSNVDVLTGLCANADGSLTVVGSSESNNGNLSSYPTNSSKEMWLINVKKHIAVFNGAVSTNWNVAANWTTNMVPDSFTDATIDADCEILSNVKCLYLTLNAGRTLTVNGSARVSICNKFINHGTLVMNSGIFIFLAYNPIPVAAYRDIQLRNTRTSIEGKIYYELEGNTTIRDLIVDNNVYVSVQSRILTITGNCTNTGTIYNNDLGGKVLLQNSTGFCHTLSGSSSAYFAVLELNSVGGCRILNNTYIIEQLILRQGTLFYGNGGTELGISTDFMAGPVVYGTWKPIHTIAGDLVCNTPTGIIHYRSILNTYNFKLQTKGHAHLMTTNRIFLGRNMLVNGTLTVANPQYANNSLIGRLDLNGYNCTVNATNTAASSGQIHCNGKRLGYDGGINIITKGYITNSGSTGALLINGVISSPHIDSLMLDTMIDLVISRPKSTIKFGKDFRLKGNANLFSPADLNNKIVNLENDGKLRENSDNGQGSVFYGLGEIRSKVSYNSAININQGELGLHIISTNSPGILTVVRKHTQSTNATGGASIRRLYLVDATSLFDIQQLKFNYDATERNAGASFTRIRINHYDFNTSNWLTITGGNSYLTGVKRTIDRNALSIQGSSFMFTASDSVSSALFPVFTQNENETKQNSYSIWPNPFVTEINISLEQDFIETIELLDINGKKVQAQNNIHSNTVKLDLYNELASGIYILNVYTENGQVFKKKVLKQ